MSEGVSSVLVAGRPGLVFQLNQQSGRRKIALASRISLLAPCVFFAGCWLVGAFVASFIAWFAILITGRYPSGLFAYNARAWRALVKINAYAFLLVDPRPSLTGAEQPGYPLQVEVEPLPTYNRLLTAFRLPVLIPLLIVQCLMTAVAFLAWFPSLVLITLVGYQPKSLQRIIASYMRIYARSISSMFLLTEIWWVTG